MKFVYFVLAITITSLNVHLAAALNCFACQQIDDPHTCNSTFTCSNNEVCFLEERSGIFSMGCATNQHCGGVANAGIVGRDVTNSQSQSTTHCLECCSTDGCNTDLCKHLKPTRCVDDESIDCARLNTLFHVCQNIHEASLVCPKFCNLCTLVDGNWAHWSTWTACDVSCSNGTMTRTRTCTNPAPASGGLDCIGSPTATKVCSKDPCPVHGGWSLWSLWGTCSVTCGVGMERRDRACSNPYPSKDGNDCQGDSRDDRICMLDGCVVHGGWSLWSPWGTCSVTCGVGMERRDRACSNPYPSKDGNYCQGDSRDDRNCMLGGCVDGGWSSWGQWGTCSDSCGGGVKLRQRTCTNPKPSLLGQYCDGGPDQVTMCNKQTCPGERIAYLATGSSRTAGEIFPTVVYNLGNGYSSSTGKFTCKVPGVYYFSSTLTKQFAINTDLVNCYLRINGISKVGSHNDPFDGTDDRGVYSITISGTFHLNTSDTVYIYCTAGASALYTDNQCSFTGFLVTPDY